ncbi:MAG: helix-turn-helix domain-containing protein [Proteobacteria bacterium]|nr:helix-turn-helix domain-containing protein [Pseudomonadota bacterium]
MSESELAAIEETYSDGLTAVQVVDIFTSRGLRFSEASFRKYVQQGLLPRSRRVGRKGKHRGSMGVYPAKTVRRVNEIKRLMAEGYTIEEIQEQFLRFADVIESLKEGFDELFSRLDEELSTPRFDSGTRQRVGGEIEEARATADELLGRLDDLSRQVSQARGDEYRSSGAAGSAEDLL